MSEPKKKYDFHEYADIFPLISKEELNSLAEDIKENGLNNSICLYQEKIIDGRNRSIACKKAGIEPTYKKLKFKSEEKAIAYVFSENFHRRHLNTAQKAEAAIKLEKIESILAKKRQDQTNKLKRDKKGKLTSKPVVSHGLTTGKKTKELKPDTKKGKSGNIVAKKLKISNKTIQKAKKIKKIAKKDPIIAKKWEQAKNGKGTITGIYKGIKLKEAKDKIIKDTKDQLKKTKYKPNIYLKDYSNYLEQFKEESVDMLLTDPPYMTEFKDIKEFVNFVNEWIPKALKKVKNTGRAYIFTGAYPKELQTYLNVILSQNRLTLSNILVWTYKNTLGAKPKKHYKNNWMAIFYIQGKDTNPLNTELLTELFGVQEINAPDGRQGNRFYKFQKPDEIAELFIRHSTKENDIIIDPFAGSGTFVLKGCNMNRNSSGAENDKEVINIAKKRGCVINE